MIAYADGERVGPIPLTCEIVPGALRVLVWRLPAYVAGPAPGTVRHGGIRSHEGDHGGRTGILISVGWRT